MAEGELTVNVEGNAECHFGVRTPVPEVQEGSTENLKALAEGVGAIEQVVGSDA